MLIENLKVGRLVMHEVYQRQQDRNAVLPTYGSALEQLSEEAMIHFRARVTEALSAQSKSMEMRVVQTGVDSAAGLAGQLIDADDPAFLTLSRSFADKLADAQMARGIPGGVLLVFEGTFGAPERPYVGVIKAETQAGFRRHRDAQAIITEFLTNIFLTPATRLYKVAFLVRPGDSASSSWQAFVFDSNITAANR